MTAPSRVFGTGIRRRWTVSGLLETRSHSRSVDDRLASSSILIPGEHDHKLAASTTCFQSNQTCHGNHRLQQDAKEDIDSKA
ncbi:hypothetical protein FH972_023023 [Carpinus fangiana]|uniref:Uncharacterized protein n=1 Tax=Carpinus fangiana TaxID=176857 RepID=A0A5N6KUC1_9ROSI|nr:hypothetical protein FH972_023023 [Carpinus fangiana]